MRILLINQFFWPDSAATSQLLTDLAVEMAARGHQVHALCAESRYAAALAGPPAVESAAQSAGAGEHPDVTIHRVKSLRFRRGKLGRVLSYLSFYVGAVWHALAGPRPDLVLTLTTPPLLSLLGTLMQIFRWRAGGRRLRHFIWEMDVYPDVAVSLGTFRAGGLLDRGVGWLADFSRRRADGLIALGPCMKQRLVHRGIPAEKISIAENWADGAAILPVARPLGREATGPGRNEGGNTAAPDRLTVLYSGNLGLAHDIETIASAMFALRHSERFSFLFVGGGERRGDLEAFCKREGIGDALFQPYVERASLGESLCAGDIGLVTQQDSCLGAVVPSKVYGLLAAGRPVLFIGPAAATPARLIAHFDCGWHLRCGDTDGLTRLLKELSANPAAVAAAGRQARRALLDYYDRPIGVARLCALLGVSSLPADVRQPSTVVGSREETFA